MVEINIEQCPHCGGKGSSSLYSDSKYTLRECVGCLLIYCDPKTVLDFNKAYSDEYYFNNYLPREKETISYYRKNVIPLIQTQVAMGSRILDIGCGTGLFLKAAKDSGFQVVGVEPSLFASQYCRKRWELECHTGFFEEMSLGKFDMIVLMNVFTHLTSDNQTLLNKIRDALAPGGKLLIKTICWNRNYPIICNLIPNEALKRMCLHLPLQLYTYNARNIQPILAGYGFKVSVIRKCLGEWSILKSMSSTRLKVSFAIVIKWMLQKLISGPLMTDMLVVAEKI